ncbi:MAG: hypothetical protein FJ246_00950 [Nitrospira sp.]|nr:hypothetical protein [Nitrospira sp.]
MKTAISIPDTEFEAAERLAKRLRVSRSQLYRKAITDFVARHAETRVTEKLNEVYAEPAESVLDELWQRAQAKSVQTNEW